MSGLVLNLKPYEKILVGGIVLQNGSRRGQIRVVDQEVGVLRYSDALHPDDVKTPLTRAYFTAQSILVGDLSEEKGGSYLLQLMREAEKGFSDFSFLDDIVTAHGHARDKMYYKVLKLLRPLLAKEAAVLLQLPSQKNIAPVEEYMPRRRAVNE